jgi:monoamine oxidase
MMKKIFIGITLPSTLLALSIQAAPCGDQVQPCQHVTTIIGGGFSGLAAAYELHKQGLDVELYEARNRVGGKVKSIEKQGLILEEGGLFIDSDHEYVLGYLKELGLEKIDKTVPKYKDYKVVTTYMMNNQAVSLEAFYDHFKPIIEYLGVQPYSTKQLDTMSYADLINTVPNASKTLKDEFLNYAELLVASEYGDSPADANANIYYDLMTWEPKKRQFKIDGQIGDERYRVKGGNDRIAKALAAKIPQQRLHMNYRLKSVTKNSDGTYQLEFSHLDRSYWVQSKYLVLTAPINLYNVVDESHKSVEKAINLNIKDLPESTKEGIRTLAYGANYKIILIFKGDVWLDERKKLEYAQITHPEFNAWNGGKGEDTNGYSSVTLFVSGREAKIFHTPAQVQKMAETFIQKVQSVLPNAKIENLVEVFPAKHWPSQPLSAGSYAGSYKPGEYGQFEYWIQSPEAGNLIFAGSDWSENYGGFMNGALETGQAAAKYIMKRANANKVTQF